jgi:hypothetical protein
VSLRVGAVEVYQDELRDLLDPLNRSKPLAIREDPVLGVTVLGAEVTPPARSPAADPPGVPRLKFPRAL